MYVKVFQTILYSSIWDEASDTRVLWITMLALADEDGFVRTTDKALAMIARLDDVTLCNALQVLQAPDPQSGNPDNEGRRVERVDGGYMILNYVKHKETNTKAERREQVRRRVAAYRGRQRPQGVTHCNACNECNTLNSTQLNSTKEEEQPPPVTQVFGVNTSENFLVSEYRRLHGVTRSQPTVLAKIQSALSYCVRADVIEAAMNDLHLQGIKAEIWQVLDPLVKAAADRKMAEVAENRKQEGFRMSLNKQIANWEEAIKNAPEGSQERKDAEWYLQHTKDALAGMDAHHVT